MAAKLFTQDPPHRCPEVLEEVPFTRPIGIVRDRYEVAPRPAANWCTQTVNSLGIVPETVAQVCRPALTSDDSRQL